MRLDDVDLDQRLDKESYREKLLALQIQARELSLMLYHEHRTAILVFEGWDAAGKGGAIRRLTSKLDPRGYRVHSIAKPEGDDARRHYLWRFWRRLDPPRDRQVLIFDRSWYGRVLVERVEGFAEPQEWQRAYREIRHFETQLSDHGTLLAKYWFHISPEEQFQRFEARRATPHKQWKLTDEDWRNRAKWGAYEEAVDDMLAKTSTAKHPWTVIAGNDKYSARIQTLSHFVELLRANLGDGAEMDAQ